MASKTYDANSISVLEGLEAVLCSLPHVIHSSSLP